MGCACGHGNCKRSREVFWRGCVPDPSDTQPLPEGNPPDLCRWGAAAMISEALSGAVTLQTLARCPASVIQDDTKDKLTVVGLHEKNSSTINFDWAFSGFDVLNHSFHPTVQLLGEHAVCKSVVVQDALHETGHLESNPTRFITRRAAASRLAICVNCYYYCNCNSATSELNVSIFRILFQVAQAAFAVKELLEQFTEAQPTSAADTFEAKIILNPYVIHGIGKGYTLASAQDRGSADRMDGRHILN